MYAEKVKLDSGDDAFNIIMMNPAQVKLIFFALVEYNNTLKNEKTCKVAARKFTALEMAEKQAGATQILENLMMVYSAITPRIAPYMHKLKFDEHGKGS